MIKLQAHRGVSGEYPENTMPAFRAAVDQGYDVIELDIRMTKDLKCVVLHDASINRTGRFADGSAIGASLPVAELTYEQVLAYDFGIGYHVKFSGTKIPLLTEVLDLARGAGIKIKIDAKCHTLRPSHKEVLFSILEDYTDVAELTSHSIDQLRESLQRFPNMHMHLGYLTDMQMIRDAADLLPPEQITYWMPIENAYTDYVTVPYVTADMAAEAKKYGSLGLWMLTTGKELEYAASLGADIVETHGSLKHEQRKGLVADMHVHTNHSHDAKYPMPEMLQAGIDHGVQVMAIADHCDTTLCEEDIEHDIYTNIREACEEVDALNKKFGDQCLLLRSVELGDGIWYPACSNKVARQLPYDVIVGATHAVRCEAVEDGRGMKRCYSQLKFNELPDHLFDDLMRNYFDDMLTMVETQNIDIMAHITCAAGYYISRHGIYKELRPYKKKIKKILEAIIRKGIAMEMNGMLFREFDGYYPYLWIVEMYYALGGYLITLSTDAHSPKAVGMGYENRIPLLKQIGFTHHVYYKDRKSVPCSL